MPTRITLFLTVLCLLAGPAVAADWYVSPTGSDLNPGTMALPFATIQHGIDAAAPGDQVLALAGTYTGAGNRDLDTGGKAITVRGVGGAAATTIDGGGSHDGFSLSFDEEDSNTVIADFTITGVVVGCDLTFAAPKLSGLVIEGAATAGVRFNWEPFKRAGPYRLVIEDCTFDGNTLGVRSWAPPTADGCHLRNCRFVDNGVGLQGLATMFGCTVTGGTVGLLTVDAISRQVVVNCEFTGVTGTVFATDPEDAAELQVFATRIHDNPGDVAYGRSIEAEYIVLALVDCDVIDNGGGIDLGGNFLTLTLDGTLYAGNGEAIEYDGATGGAFSCTGSTVAYTGGNGLLVGSVNGTITIANTIAAYNAVFGIAVPTAGAGFTIDCNDVFGNAGADYGYIPDQTGSSGNISVDPLFCDPPAGDYALAADSPCSEDNSACGRMGARSVGCGPPAGSWYVATSGDDANPGTPALPFRTIARGVAAAAAGDTVHVLDGRYVEHVAITGPLVLRSMSGDTTACTIEAPSGYRVITVTTATDTVRIDGFELTGGTPSQGDVGGYDLGGGILAVGTPVVVSNCHIHDNVLPADQSRSAGGGVHVREGSYLRLERCKVADNWAPRAGGVCIRHDAGADLYGNLIVRNGADLNAGGLWILPDATTAARYLLAGNTVAANSTTGNGSGANFNLLDDLVLRHNIFAHNDCPLAQVQFNGTVVDMDCNLVYWGTPYLADGPYDASGNIHEGPRFCDLADGDFSLNELSPAAPGGPVCGLIGALGVGCVPVSGVNDPSDGAVPTVFALGQAYPNPFNPMTTIDYHLPRAAPVWLAIYALDGRRVRVLKSGEVEGPGRGEAIWRGRDDGGRPLAAGLYVYRLRAGDFTATRKVMLLK